MAAQPTDLAQLLADLPTNMANVFRKATEEMRESVESSAVSDVGHSHTTTAGRIGDEFGRALSRLVPGLRSMVESAERANQTLRDLGRAGKAAGGLKADPSSQEFREAVRDVGRGGFASQERAGRLRESYKDFLDQQRERKQAEREDKEVDQRLKDIRSEATGLGQRYRDAQRQYAAYTGVPHPELGQARTEEQRTRAERELARIERSDASGRFRAAMGTPGEAKARAEHDLARAAHAEARRRHKEAQDRLAEVSGPDSHPEAQAGKEAMDQVRTRATELAREHLDATRKKHQTATEAARARGAEGKAKQALEGEAVAAGTRASFASSALGGAAMFLQAVQAFVGGVQQMRQWTAQETVRAFQMAPYSGKAITANMELAIGDLKRSIQFSQMTGDTAATLARSENRARQAWVPFDSAWQNARNLFGTGLNSLGESLANMVSPLANQFNRWATTEAASRTADASGPRLLGWLMDSLTGGLGSRLAPVLKDSDKDIDRAGLVGAGTGLPAVLDRMAELARSHPVRLPVRKPLPGLK